MGIRSNSIPPLFVATPLFPSPIISRGLRSKLYDSFVGTRKSPAILRTAIGERGEWSGCKHVKDVDTARVRKEDGGGFIGEKPRENSGETRLHHWARGSKNQPQDLWAALISRSCARSCVPQACAETSCMGVASVGLGALFQKANYFPKSSNARVPLQVRRYINTLLHSYLRSNKVWDVYGMN